MKLSRKWLQDYIDLSSVTDEELTARMTALGHKMTTQQKGDETFFEIDSPENRPDCCSIMGLVREISAALRIPHRSDSHEAKGTDKFNIYEMLDADVWAEHLCNRFSCRIAVNVNIGPSPDWISQRLEIAGITPINCLIDAANYAALEYGQKITLLDYGCVTSGSLWIREAMPGEEFSSDLELPVLSDNMTPLACGDTPVCPEVQITQDTTSVIAIAADYSATSVDPMLTVPALERFCQLLEQLKLGEIADGIIDLLNYVPQPRTLPFDISAINDTLGFGLTAQSMIDTLKWVDIQVVDQEIVLPSHRTDLLTLADIAAEIKRIHITQA